MSLTCRFSIKENKEFLLICYLRLKLSSDFGAFDNLKPLEKYMFDVQYVKSLDGYQYTK